MVKIINTKTNKDTNFDYAISFTEEVCLFRTKDGKLDYAKLEDLLIVKE